MVVFIFVVCVCFWYCWCDQRQISTTDDKKVVLLLLRHFLFVADACFEFELRQVISLSSILFLKINFIHHFSFL